MLNNNSKSGATTIHKVGRIIGLTVKGAWYSFWILSGLACILLVGIVIFQKRFDGKITTRYALYKYECRDGFRIKDTERGKWVTGRLASVDKTFFSDSLIRISKRNLFNGKELYGYFDIRTAKIAIKPQFETAGEFSEGLAAVARGEHMGFIDINGVLCYEFKHKLRDIEHIALINGYAIAHSEDIEGGYGIINSCGEFVLEPQHYCIDNAFSDIFVVSQEVDKQGIWSASNGWIIEPSKLYIDYSLCTNRFTITDKGFSYEVDSEGKVTKSFVFNNAELITYTPRDCHYETEITTEYVRFSTMDGRYGVYNSLTKMIVLPAEYSSIYMLSKDLFVVSDDVYDSEFFVDKNGKVVEPKGIVAPHK